MSEQHFFGPQVPFSDRLHAEKYRGVGETFREAAARVASALADDERHFQAFRDILLHERFSPAGRVQAAMGATKAVTPYNCFVSGVIEDSFVDGHGSIMSRATEAAATMRMGGGIGYDFSSLRPRGATIKKLQSQSSGPIKFMEIYDSVGRCVASSGHRRGAQMAVFRVDHPDIEEFVRAKQNEGNLTSFNVSVGITDEFMEARLAGKPFQLRFGREVYREVDPRALWEMIMRSTWDWAEPGVLFLDAINRENNLRYCETISATNPCGEQPLPPYGACLLGSFNLVKYVCEVGSPAARFFDWAQLLSDIPLVVRAMDNVVDRAIYPLFEQEKEAKSKRRMGLGVMGLANALEALGLPYASAGFVDLTVQIMTTIRDEAYLASVRLAQEKGSFPLFDRDRYLESPFVKRLPADLQQAIHDHGIRNSHLVSIAPTGTIAMCADNISSGIEPVFDYAVRRTVIGREGPEEAILEDYGARVFGVRGRRISDLSALEHLSVLAAVQPFVDSGVSKTVNVPNDTSWTEFKDLYHQAWVAGCKGCTTYRVGGKRGAVIVSAESGSGGACVMDPVSGRRDCGE